MTQITAAPEPTRLRSPRRITVTREGVLVVALRLAVLAVMVIAWQFSPHGAVPAVALSRPSSIWTEFWQIVANGSLFKALWATVVDVVYGMLIGGPIGALLAVLTSVPVGRWLLQPIVTVTYAIPKVALITMFVLIFGVSDKTHVILVAIGVLFVYYFSVRQALAEVDVDRRVALELMGASRLKVLRSLVLPSTLPHFVAASRVALPLAFVIEIFAELRVPTASGLGVLLNNYAIDLDAAGSMAVLIFITFIAYLLDVFLRGRLQRFAMLTGTGFQV